MTAVIWSGAGRNKIGGMEIHLHYLIANLVISPTYERLFFITKSAKQIIVREEKSCRVIFFAEFEHLGEYLKKIPIDMMFFNDGHWIEHFDELRKNFQQAIFVMRSGGNEFVKAPWRDMSLSLNERQRSWSNAINTNIDYIIANSIYTWQRMVNIGIAPEKILIVRGGVDLVLAEKNIARKNVLRDKFDCRYNTIRKFIFCIVARHVKFKGIAKILKIFKALKSNKWFLLILGTGEESPSLCQYCLDNFLEDNFAFVGEVSHEEALEYISLSDYLISSSVDTLRLSGDETYLHTETMGRSIIEAVSQKVPVIAFDAGGVGEWFENIPGIGVLLSRDLSEPENIFQCALDKKFGFSVTKDLTAYGWDYIINFFYTELFKQRREFIKTALCFDLEGSIVHNFLTYEQNIALLEEIFSWSSEDCTLIINSAGDFWEILERYPIIANNLEHITVIANGGEVIVKYGKRDILWQEYHHMQPAISDQEIEFVNQEIFHAGLKLIRKRIVNDLYVNFKVVGNVDTILQVVHRLNNSLSNATRQVIANAGNIKIISKIINKYSALAYLKNFQLKSQRIIGIGNDVLDEMFLAHCDKAFFVNPIRFAVDSVKIESLDDANLFLRQLRKEVFTPT